MKTIPRATHVCSALGALVMTTLGGVACGTDAIDRAGALLGGGEPGATDADTTAVIEGEGPGPSGVRDQLSEVAERGDAEEAAIFDDVSDYADADIDGVRFSFNRSLSARLKHRRPEHLRLAVPTKDGALHLELYRVQLTAPDFVVATDASASDSPIDGVHYRGVVEDDDQSLAAISIYDDGVAGFISTGSKLFNLAKQKGANHHVSYRVDTLAAPAALGCNNDELGDAITPGASRSSLSFVGNKFVGVYFEADYRMFQDHGGSVTNTTNYITAMFNQVATLYANESIDIRIASLFVWTSPDPYATMNSTSSVLTAFQSNVGTSYTGNLAFFLTTRPLNGGIAYVDVVCNKAYAFGMAAVLNNFANVPTYSWSVEAVTHELGHNFGSPHTQSCSWPGGAIDNCYTPEGSCASGPAPTNGGTVMSYCHLTNAGINFNNGFGPLPGDLIRGRVTNGSCLATATTDTTAPTVSIVTASATMTAHTTLAIDVAASDDTAVTRVELSKNGVLFGSDTTAPWSFPWSTSGEANGSYSFTAKAFDGAGNSATSASISVTLSVPVDTTAPSAPANLTGTRKGKNVKLAWGVATDNVGVVAYLVVRNGIVIAQTTATTATSGLVPGTNSFTLVARDAAGNVSVPSNTVVMLR